MGDTGVRCIIFKNVHDHGDGRLVSVPGTLDAFLKMAGEKLKCKAERAYTDNGGYIDDVALIRDDEKIFISGGEPFFKTDSSKVKTYKIAVLGSGGVGKSCLSMRYVRSTFVDIYDPTIEDAFRHQTVIDGVTCILDILDTAGQEDMKMLRRQWIEDRDGFMLVFSIADRASFEDLDQFYELIVEIKEGNMAKIPLVLVGNKADLVDKRQVSSKEASEDAAAKKAIYLETSAKNGESVSEAFETLVRHFIRLDPPKPVAKTPAKSTGKKPFCFLL